MTISLPPAQLEWLARQVARGEFRSVDAAIVQLLDERIAERSAEADDLAWAQPYVNEALAAVAHGEVISAEAHAERMNQIVASLKD